MLSESRRTAVINIVGLSQDLLGPHLPRLTAFAERGKLVPVDPLLPAVTSCLPAPPLPCLPAPPSPRRRLRRCQPLPSARILPRASLDCRALPPPQAALPDLPSRSPGAALPGSAAPSLNLPGSARWLPFLPELLR